MDIDFNNLLRNLLFMLQYGGDKSWQENMPQGDFRQPQWSSPNSADSGSQKYPMMNMWNQHKVSPLEQMGWYRQINNQQQQQPPQGGQRVPPNTYGIRG